MSHFAPEEISEDFAGVLWHYHLQLAVDGSDRRNLPLALDGEVLAFETHIGGRDALHRMIAKGRIDFRCSLEQPIEGFAADIELISTYLFTLVRGLEVRETIPAGTDVANVRAVKFIGRKGEVVAVPLLVTLDDGRLIVDPEVDDTDRIAERWNDWPRWFQDGMRLKYARFRAL